MDYKRLSRISDSSKTDRQAESLITKDKIWELYEDGEISVKIPQSTNIKQLIASVKDRIQEMWGDEEVNFQFDLHDFEVTPSDGVLNIAITDSTCKITLNV